MVSSVFDTMLALADPTGSEIATDDEPFFLWANFWGPHSPSLVPEPYYSMYDPKDIREHPSYKETFEGKPYRQQLIEKLWGLGDYGWEGFQKIGARYFSLGKGGNGTIQSTQRMWISKGISTKDSVTFKVKELDGKLYVGAHVCVLEPGKTTPVYKKTVYFNKGDKQKKNKKQTQTIKVNGAKGKIVFFKISAQKPSANKFKYSFTTK